jgi:hypothetical protein
LELDFVFVRISDPNPTVLAESESKSKKKVRNRNETLFLIVVKIADQTIKKNMGFLLLHFLCRTAPRSNERHYFVKFRIKILVRIRKKSFASLILVRLQNHDWKNNLG